jgi:hypothetical protein
MGKPTTAVGLLKIGRIKMWMVMLANSFHFGDTTAAPPAPVAAVLHRTLRM